eukprot:3660084-Rhodomonas_salina.2
MDMRSDEMRSHITSPLKEEKKPRQLRIPARCSRGARTLPGSAILRLSAGLRVAQPEEGACQYRTSRSARVGG